MAQPLQQTPGSNTPYASASLYVGDLANDVTEALLFEIFNAVGPVASVRVCRDAATRRSLGYAYVNFHRVEDAERALDTMNFKNIRNHPCRIMWSHRDPSLRKSGAGNIFVKNLAKSIDNKSLYDTFSMFGNILSCKVACNGKRESLGYGFVHYETEEAANNAISRVNEKMIAGEKVSVSVFKSRKERGKGNNMSFTNVYVKNLPTEWDIAKVQAEFSKFGEITSPMLARDDEGTSLGFGFINYKNPEEAAAAVEALNEKEFGDKKVYVMRAQKKAEREKELRDRFESLKIERQKKYAGVNLYVKNLGDDVDEEALRKAFTAYGNISSVRVMVDEAKKTKGFGFVCFSTPEEATKCVTEMNGHMLHGKPLYVALAQRKDVRRQQLEAQYATRAKMGVPGPQPQMFPNMGQIPGGPAPMFYQGMPQRNMVYPQQIMRQWNPQTAGMMRPHPVNYQLMSMNQQRTPAGGNNGGNNGGARGGNPGGQNRQGGPRGQPSPKPPQQGGNNQQNFKYADNVRNQRDQRGAAVPAHQAAPEAVAQAPRASEPLTVKALAAAPEEQQKQMIGERLFPLIKAQQPAIAGKITGMLLEMDNGELLHLLESAPALSDKIEEALQVLNSATTDGGVE